MNYICGMTLGDPSINSGKTRAEKKRVQELQTDPEKFDFDGESALEKYHDMFKSTKQAVHLAHNGSKFDNWLVYAHLKNKSKHPSSASFRE